MSKFTFRLHRIHQFKTQEEKQARQKLQQCQTEKIATEERLADLLTQIQTYADESLQTSVGEHADPAAACITWIAGENYLGHLNVLCHQAVLKRQEAEAAWREAKAVYEAVATQVKAFDLLKEQQEAEWIAGVERQQELEQTDRYLNRRRPA